MIKNDITYNVSIDSPTTIELLDNVLVRNYNIQCSNADFTSSVLTIVYNGTAYDGYETTIHYWGTANTENTSGASINILGRSIGNDMLNQRFIANCLYIDNHWIVVVSPDIDTIDYIGEDSIKDAAITTDKLSTDSVTNDKIADEAIGGENLKTVLTSGDGIDLDTDKLVALIDANKGFEFSSRSISIKDNIRGGVYFTSEGPALAIDPAYLNILNVGLDGLFFKYNTNDFTDDPNTGLTLTGGSSSVSKVVTSAQLLSLGTAPVELLPEVSGKAYDVISVIIEGGNGSNGYTNPSLTINNPTATTPISTFTDVIKSPAAFIKSAAGADVRQTNIVRGERVQLQSETGSNPAGGDFNITVHLNYRLI